MSIFGGNTGITYEQLQKRKRIAEQLRRQNSRTPKNVGEGIHAIARALVARGVDKQTRAREKELKEAFDERFAQVAPNTQGLMDLANSPHASSSHKGVIKALMEGAPNYKRGTAFHPGGRAVVGEDGPEVIDLPYGAAVMPSMDTQADFGMGLDPADSDFLYELPEPLQGQAIERIRRGESAPDVLMEIFQQQQQMQQYDPASQQRMQQQGEPPLTPEFDGREMLGPESSLQPEPRFDDANARRMAELDAFRLMDLQPQYGNAVEADINTTEGGRLSLLRRMMFADAALEDPRLAESMTKMDQSIAGRLGALGRLYTSDEFELGKLMSEQFANAVLRNDSGAQAPDSEVQRYMQQYFPLPNDSPSQLRAKAALRREVIRSVVQALGGDASPAARQVIEEINQLRNQADVPDGSLGGNPAPSSEADADGWKTVNGVRIRVKK
jgi:hypothetical protein